ncbi:MAG TPA: hypothetical protein VHZ76_10360 [Gammaproteobacteria bacterium]|nr:hypothetical protein [Gammaproteobacteria bacterium]
MAHSRSNLLPTENFVSPLPASSLGLGGATRRSAEESDSSDDERKSESAQTPASLPARTSISITTEETAEELRDSVSRFLANDPARIPLRTSTSRLDPLPEVDGFLMIPINPTTSAETTATVPTHSNRLPIAIIAVVGGGFAILYSCNQGIEGYISLSFSTLEPRWLEILAATSILATEMVLCTPTTIKNLQESLNMILNKQLPPEWPTLSSKLKNIVNIVMVPATLATLFSMTLRPLSVLPSNKISPFIFYPLTATLGVSALVTGFSSRVYESYKNLYFWLAGHENMQFSLLSKFIGYPLTTTDMLQDAINAFTLLTLFFQAEEFSALLTLAGISASMMVTYQLFFGIYTIKALDSFIHYCKAGRYKAEDFFAFIMAMALAGILAYSMQPFNRKHLEDFITDYFTRIDPTSVIFSKIMDAFTWIISASNLPASTGAKLMDAFTWVVAGSNFSLATGAGTVFMHELLAVLKNTNRHVYNIITEKIASCCPSSSDEERQHLLAATITTDTQTINYLSDEVKEPDAEASYTAPEISSGILISPEQTQISQSRSPHTFINKIGSGSSTQQAPAISVENTSITPRRCLPWGARASCTIL